MAHHGQARAGVSRRGFLRLGSGLVLATSAAPFRPILSAAGSTAPRRTARSCILVYLLGGPPHLDMFDLKPEAPAEIRGPFRPIPTNVAGLEICEHLPRLASIADRYTLVRSVTHPNSNHTPMIYYTLTGRHTDQPSQDNDIRPPQRSDFPHTGAVVARFADSRSTLPGYVALPELAIRSSTAGEFKRSRSPLRGGGAGFLGASLDPLSISGAPGTREAIPSLTLPKDVSALRFQERSELLGLLEGRQLSEASTQRYQLVRDRAIVLTGTANDNQAQVFSLDNEPLPIRERYGRNRFGDSLILARRLATAGVPLVAVHFNEMTVCDGWDTHSKNFEALQSELLPMLDQGLSALLGDLENRGQFDETLVVCMGEFGRTPKINANAGRDHWGDCSTTLLAGGGISGGQVWGASDRHGAFPVAGPVDPVDIQATLYHCLGLPGETLMYDHLHRPHAISTGRVLHQLL